MVVSNYNETSELKFKFPAYLKSKEAAKKPQLPQVHEGYKKESNNK